MAPPPDPGAGRALVGATLALLLCFVAWGSIAPLAPLFAEEYGLSQTQAGTLVAAPVLLGALGRIPLGMLADRFGGRRVFAGLLLALVVPVGVVPLTGSFAGLLAASALLGLAGASFAVGVPFVSRWTSRRRQGIALGIYGMGNAGTGIAALVVPAVAARWGWRAPFLALIPLLAAAALLFWAVERDAPAPRARGIPARSLARRPAAWLLSLFYFVTFGGFVALGAYLPTYLVLEFGLDRQDAGARAGGFVLLATLARPLGGLLADRRGGIWTLDRTFPGVAALAVVLAFGPGIEVATAAFLGTAFLLGLGNGAVFKLVPELFPRDTGAAGGLVSTAGALGGFFPPLVMGFVRDATGAYAVGFMLLSEVALVCFVLALLMGLGRLGDLGDRRATAGGE
ncbi:MFS transporter [Myxococcota bacterium]|nr:MFS transporter [Myxococcota bacterium]